MWLKALDMLYIIMPKAAPRRTIMCIVHGYGPSSTSIIYVVVITTAYRAYSMSDKNTGSAFLSIVQTQQLNKVLYIAVVAHFSQKCEVFLYIARIELQDCQAIKSWI